MTEVLKDVLASVATGRVEDPDKIRQITDALARCWGDLKGGQETSMEAYKLSGRTEDIVWEPPYLSFTIERHGRTVNSSTRADLHRWEVNVEDGSASWRSAGHRQLCSMAKAFRAAPVADEIVRKILEGVDDRRLKWKEYPVEVVVDIAAAVPDGGAQQTTTARRKRFRTECEDRLRQHGWEVVSYNKYRKSKTDGAS